MNNSNGWNKMKGAIRLQVTSNVNDTKNCLCKQYANLYVIPYLLFVSETKRKMIKITKEICKKFDVSEEAVFKFHLKICYQM